MKRQYNTKANSARSKPRQSSSLTRTVTAILDVETKTLISTPHPFWIVAASEVRESSNFGPLSIQSSHFFILCDVQTKIQREVILPTFQCIMTHPTKFLREPCSLAPCPHEIKYIVQKSFVEKVSVFRFTDTIYQNETMFLGHMQFVAHSHSFGGRVTPLTPRKLKILFDS